MIKMNVKQLIEQLEFFDLDDRVYVSLEWVDVEIDYDMIKRKKKGVLIG